MILSIHAERSLAVTVAKGIKGAVVMEYANVRPCPDGCLDDVPTDKRGLIPALYAVEGRS